MQIRENKLLRIGTAGWSLSSDIRNRFPSGSSLLERYSQQFNAVEINSSFYRSHKKTTYQRWAATTPLDFQFAVKMPKQITHNKRLIEIEIHLDGFIEEICGLQTKLGPILIQLPPSLNFEFSVIDSFFSLLRSKFNGKIVLEPRHISWSKLEAISLLQVYNIDHVIADPVKVPIESTQQQPFKYFRLHGSPKIYSSSYDNEFLNQLAKQLNVSSWVIFDNTKLGAATRNALDLLRINVD